MPKTKEKPVIPNITNYNSVLLGLMGHVDSGKTAVAKLISQIISTAGLDAHPQSKERGITIDLGFTSLIKNNNLITLVDAPGHADLIRSVVASANIIEGAIMVVDGKEGIQIQTAEHLVILESLGISKLIVVINKIDIISQEQLSNLESRIKRTLNASNFDKSTEIIKLSAKTGAGAEELNKAISKLIKTIIEERKSSQFKSAEKNLVFPIDHHFKIKGKGIIVTGTTQTGSINEGDNLTILPQKLPIKVKSLQVYHQKVNSVKNGYRVGVGITGIENKRLNRGDILTNNPTSYKIGEIAEIELSMNNYFKKTIHFGAQINVTMGLSTLNARIFMYEEIEDTKLILKNINFDSIKNYIDSSENGDKKSKIHAYLWFLDPQFLKLDENLLFSQLDLPPTTLRFFGTGKILRILNKDEKPFVEYIKTKTGKIKNANYGKNEILIEGLAQSKMGANTLINKQLDSPFGKITATFGSKGVVVAKISSDTTNGIKSEEKIIDGQKVTLKLKRKKYLDKNRAY